MSILSLNNVSLKLAENVVLDQVNWQIQPKDRIALVGRNGAGKSTLLNLLHGDITADSGQIQKSSGLRIAGLTQDVPISLEETVYHFLVKQLGEAGEVLAKYRIACADGHLKHMARCEEQIEALQAWELLPQVDIMASRLGLPMDALMDSLSGGMRRRVLLASALIAKADLLLLDEPTNHLDMDAIEWLESYLAQYSGSIIVVTHDRQFLSQIANRIVEIDRGNLQSYDCNYETYLDRREARRLAEKTHDNLFDKRLKEEEVWIRQGIQARRTRNEGRVRRLKAMREDYRQRRSQQDKVKTVALQASYSGKTVIEAKNINYSINQQPLIRDFSFLLTRGDKVGIIGPNGCGKTTLIRLLLGELTPDSGAVHQGTSLEIAYFDQLRRQLDENQTVMANVADGADYVTINGQQKHVASYLKDFLFAPERFNQPVFSLSGGERNRLLLARLLAKPVNLLVMDEPTNDLDIETMELLETLLLDYPGTLLIISHDREFINQIVSSVLVYEGHGHFNEFIGDYDDYRAHKKQRQTKAPTAAATPSTQRAKSSNTLKLSYNEQRELEQLPLQIEQLEKTIKHLHLKMLEPEFYQQTPQDMVQFNTELATQEKQLSAHYLRWEALEDKNGKS